MDRPNAGRHRGQPGGPLAEVIGVYAHASIEPTEVRMASEFPQQMIDAARKCLIHQVGRWNAERELEVMLQAHLGTEDDIETEDDIKGLCVCLDEIEDVTDDAALQLLRNLLMEVRV